MVGIKKNWLYDISYVLVILESIMIILGIVALIGGRFFEGQMANFFINLYNSWFPLLVIIVFAYPMYILRSIFPKCSLDNLYMETGNLPFSKKELFMMSLKDSWLRLLGLLAICMCINMSLEGSLIPKISESIDIALVMLILFFQVFVMYILYFSKKISGKKVIGKVIGIDLFVLMTLLIIGRIIGNDFIGSVEFLFIAGGTFFIGSFIGFLKYWNDIERICN